MDIRQIFGLEKKGMIGGPLQTMRESRNLGAGPFNSLVDNANTKPGLAASETSKKTPMPQIKLN